MSDTDNSSSSLTPSNQLNTTSNESDTKPGGGIITILQQSKTPAAGITDQQRRAMKLRLAGKSLESIGKTLGVTRQTVARWLKAVAEESIRELEQESSISILTQQLQGLKDLENKARRGADTTKSDRQRISCLNAAARFQKMQLDIMVTVGILPKQAEKIFAVVSENKIQTEEEREIPKNKGQLISEIIDNLDNIRSI